MAPRDYSEKVPSPLEEMQVDDDQLALGGLGSMLRNQEAPPLEIADETKPEDAAETEAES